MGKSRVYEGTWQQLAEHAAEFQAYPKLTLIVPGDADMDEEVAEVGMDLAEALKDYVGTAHFGEANLSEDTGRKFAQLLEEKHRAEQ